MAKNATVQVPAKTWTELTDADVTAITFQNRSDYDVFIVVQTTDTSPAGFDDALVYAPGNGERNVALSDLAPGLTSPDRVFAYSRQNAEVFVSHA